MRALLVIDIQKSYITKYETDIVQRINERNFAKNRRMPFHLKK